MGKVGRVPSDSGRRSPSIVGEQLQTFSSLLNQIRFSYVDSVSYARMLHAAIDEGSASAAEALAPSLQDHDRALLLGRRSCDEFYLHNSSGIRSAQGYWDRAPALLTAPR